jgi:hypothetical protein
VDNLGGGMTMDGKVHFVLNGREELLGNIRTGIIVDAGGINLQYFPVKYLF